jgi:iron complex transport system substrate-binding protein
MDLETDPFFGPPRALRMLGQMLGVESKAEEMASLASTRTSELLARVDKLREGKRVHPVLYFEQGNTVPEKFGVTDGDIESSWGLIWHRLGADNIGVGSNFQVLNPERIITRNPDLIVIGGSNWDPVSNIMRMGFLVTPDIAKRHLTEYTQRLGWSDLKAIRNERLYGLHYNYGPAWEFTCFEAMVKMLYPDDFQDLDPEKDMAAFFAKYMLVPYSGVHSVRWRIER